MLTLAGLAAAAAACNPDGTSPSEEAEQRFAEGDQRGEALAADLRDELLASPSGDELLAKIASTVEALDDGEIRQADLVAGRVRDSDTLALASLIARDHRDAEAQLDAMLTARDVEPIDHSVTAALVADGDAGYEMLVTMRGASLEREYTLMQISMHAEALPILDEIDLQIRDAGVRAFVGSLRGTVDRHLTAAMGLASE
jgi:hypothetical protein